MTCIILALNFHIIQLKLIKAYGNHLHFIRSPARAIHYAKNRICSINFVLLVFRLTQLIIIIIIC
jgi:hypothetical protein